MSIIKDDFLSNPSDTQAEVKLCEGHGIASNTSLKSLSSIVQLKSNKEFKGIFEQFQEVFASMTNGDFSKRIFLSNRKNLFSYFGSAINSVMEELEVNVVKTHYLESTLDFIADMAFLTNKEGELLFINSNVASFLNVKKIDILNIPIKQLIEFETSIDSVSESEVPVESSIKFNNFTSKIFVKGKKLYDSSGEHDGFLFIAQEILTGSYKIKNLNNRYIVK